MTAAVLREIDRAEHNELCRSHFSKWCNLQPAPRRLGLKNWAESHKPAAVVSTQLLLAWLMWAAVGSVLAGFSGPGGCGSRLRILPHGPRRVVLRLVWSSHDWCSTGRREGLSTGLTPAAMAVASADSFHCLLGVW